MYVSADFGGGNTAAASNPHMKIITPSLLFILTTCGAFGLTGCFHHQPKSSARIIDVGDPNPYITSSPTRAGTVVRRASDPR